MRSPFQSLFLVASARICQDGSRYSTAVFADVLNVLGEGLAIPIITGIAIGVALRSSDIAREVTNHDQRAEEILIDLVRWVRDRGRALDAEMYRAINLGRQGIIEDVVAPPVPSNVGGKPGDQTTAGSFPRRIERLMRQALHEYRDEASGKVSEYRQMARGEGRLHRLIRRCRHNPAPTALELSKRNRETLASWRSREVPVYGTPTATVTDDPTRAEDAKIIWPLEEGGLTWITAREHSARQL
jgi:hypothetical protein